MKIEFIHDLDFKGEPFWGLYRPDGEPGEPWKRKIQIEKNTSLWCKTSTLIHELVHVLIEVVVHDLFRRDDQPFQKLWDKIDLDLW